MKFTIPCETFCRMASVVNFFEPRTELEIRKQLECVRIENRKGKSFAIASNQQIAAIEFIGNTIEADGACHVVVDPVLVEQCAAEVRTLPTSFLQITTIPEIALGTAMTMLGYNYNGNACIWPQETVMDKWRDWGPDAQPKKNNGALYLETDHIQTLFQASPSGRVIFPSIIDVDIPVVLRDRKNPSWVGLFLGKPIPTEVDAKPAVLPDWWR